MENFEKIISEKLRDVEIKPSARLFSRIEESLAQIERPAVVTKQRRFIALWGSVSAAAAVVTLAILFAVRQTETPLLNIQNQNPVSTTTADVIPTLPTEPNTESKQRVSDILLASIGDPSIEDLYADATEPVSDDNAIVTADDVDSRVNEALDNGGKRRRGNNRRNWWDRIEEDQIYADNSSRNSSLSFYGGNFGLLSGNMVQNNPTTSLADGRMATPSSVTASPTFGDTHLTLADRVVEESLIHRMPISAGISVSFPISQDSITGGLNYSYLESVSKESRALQNNESRMVRELHYVGISGAITYTPYQTKYFDLYISGNVTLEKAVYARLTETTKYDSGADVAYEKLEIAGVQPSLSAAAGVMFNVTPWLGLYVEPGVAYYFNTGQPKNYRTENPVSFSLQVGLRFNWK